MDQAELVSVAVEQLESPPIVLVSVRGELDFSTTARLIDALNGQPPDGQHLVFDLAGLQFCDSSGLGALIAAHKATAAGGGRMYLAAVSPTVLTAITVTSLDQLFDIRDSVDVVLTEVSPA